MNPTSELRFTQAQPEDYPAIAAFYQDVISAVTGTENDPIWEWGVHPRESELAVAIEDGGMLLAWDRASQRLAAVGILNEECALGYKDVAWQTPTEPGDFAVLHLFAVHPDFQGRGIARATLEHIQSEARSCGYAALRFDVIGNNKPAMRMYERCGFSCCGPTTLTYPGEPGQPDLFFDFVMYEKAL